MNTKKITCTYRITHYKTGKLYFGSTNDFQRRKGEHESALRRNCHVNKELQDLYNDDPNIFIEILEITQNRDEAFDFEQKHLDQNATSPYLLNKERDAKGWFIPGSVCSDERKQAISRANTGRQHTPETKKQIGDTQRGRKRPEASIEKQRESRLKNARSVSIKGVVYSNIVQAIQELGLDYNTISNRVRSQSESFKDWFFVETS